MGLGYDYRESTSTKNVVYEDYVAVAYRLARKLRFEDKVDYIIALAHIPFEGGPQLIIKVPEIDLCLMGHNHFWNYRTVNNVNIVEGDLNLEKLSIIDVSFYRNKFTNTLVRQEKVSYEVPDGNKIPKDPAMDAIVQKYLNLVGKEYKQVIGSTNVTLVCEEIYVRTRETNIGDFLADALANWGRSVLNTSYPVLGMQNSGGMRWAKNVSAGPLTKGDIVDLLPFGNVYVIIQLTCKELRQILEKKAVYFLPNPDGGFFQISGFRFNHTCKLNVPPPGGDCETPPGSRVLNITYSNYTIIPEDQILNVVLPSLFLSDKLFVNFTVVVDEDSGVGDIELIMGVIQAKSPISPVLDNRIMYQSILTS